MVRLNEGIVSQEIDDGFVIVDTTTGRYLTANRTADVMISLLADGLDEDQVVAALRGRLPPVEDERLRADLRELATALVGLGLAVEE
jgi:hypothetical protein